jgi:iron complex outermembrane receptor protein
MRGIFGLTVQQQLMTSAAAIVMMASATPAMAQTRTFNVPAGPASRSIPIFAKQAGVQILASGDIVKAKRTKAVRGNLTVEEGLRRLLDDTGLATNGNANGIITIGVAAAGNGQAVSSTTDDESLDEDERGKSEILVVGSRSQNVDIRRTEDDPQPYVVLNQQDIQKKRCHQRRGFAAQTAPDEHSVHIKWTTGK